MFGRRRFAPSPASPAPCTARRPRPCGDRLPPPVPQGSGGAKVGSISLTLPRKKESTPFGVLSSSATRRYKIPAAVAGLTWENSPCFIRLPRMPPTPFYHTLTCFVNSEFSFCRIFPPPDSHALRNYSPRAYKISFVVWAQVTSCPAKSSSVRSNKKRILYNCLPYAIPLLFHSAPILSQADGKIQAAKLHSARFTLCAFAPAVCTVCAMYRSPLSVRMCPCER